MAVPVATPSDTAIVAPERPAVVGPPQFILRAEGAALFVACVLAYRHLGLNWAEFALLFLAPDLAMAGYALGPKVGAATYNALHIIALPLALGAVAVLLPAPALVPVALVWLAHIGLDRTVAYGLKYGSDFRDTHLGRIGGSYPGRKRA